VAMQ